MTLKKGLPSHRWQQTWTWVFPSGEDMTWQPEVSGGTPCRQRRAGRGLAPRKDKWYELANN